jgi:hypothetical protein
LESLCKKFGALSTTEAGNSFSRVSELQIRAALLWPIAKPAWLH